MNRNRDALVGHFPSNRFNGIIDNNINLNALITITIVTNVMSLNHSDLSSINWRQLNRTGKHAANRRRR